VFSRLFSVSHQRTSFFFLVDLPFECVKKRRNNGRPDIAYKPRRRRFHKQIPNPTRWQPKWNHIPQTKPYDLKKKNPKQIPSKTNQKPRKKNKSNNSYTFPSQKTDDPDYTLTQLLKGMTLSTHQDINQTNKRYSQPFRHPNISICLALSDQTIHHLAIAPPRGVKWEIQCWRHHNHPNGNFFDDSFSFLVFLSLPLSLFMFIEHEGRAALVWQYSLLFLCLVGCVFFFFAFFSPPPHPLLSVVTFQFFFLWLLVNYNNENTHTYLHNRFSKVLLSSEQIQLEEMKNFEQSFKQRRNQYQQFYQKVESWAY